MKWIDSVVWCGVVWWRPQRRDVSKLFYFSFRDGIYAFIFFYT